MDQESFDRLLAWLDPDRERAGLRLEKIRRRLIRLFRGRSCPLHDAESLADKTIDRVAQKLPEIIENYVGEPEKYFYRVADYIYKEYLKDPHKRSPDKEFSDNENPRPDTPARDDADKERRYDCLEECLKKLDEKSRQLIHDYYRQEKRAKIDHRQELADRLGIDLPTLRTRVYRIRQQLRKCVDECLQEREETDIL